MSRAAPFVLTTILVLASGLFAFHWLFDDESEWWQLKLGEVRIEAGEDLVGACRRLDEALKVHHPDWQVVLSVQSTHRILRRKIDAGTNGVSLLEVADRFDCDCYLDRKNKCVVFKERLNPAAHPSADEAGR